MGARIIERARHEQQRRIILVEMVAGRSEGVEIALLRLGAAEKGAVKGIVGRALSSPMRSESRSLCAPIATQACTVLDGSGWPPLPSSDATPPLVARRAAR